MCKDKQVIEAEEVGSLEEVLGFFDPLFQPELEAEPAENESTKPQETKNEV